MRYHFDGIEAIVNENDQLVFDGIADERTADFLLSYMNGYENTKELLTEEIDINRDLLAACEAFVEAWERCLQLEKTDVALRMAKVAIERARETS